MLWKTEAVGSGVALAVADHVLAEIVRICEAAGNGPAAGALVGVYSDDCSTCSVDAVIAYRFGDASTVGQSSPEFNNDDAVTVFQAVWPTRYYVGDWHWHPAAGPVLHDVDCETIRATAVDPNARCPNPVHVLAYADGAAIKFAAFIAHAFDANGDAALVAVPPLPQGIRIVAMTEAGGES